MIDAETRRRALQSLRRQEAPDPRAEAVLVAAALCRRFEGLYLSPYLCPAGVPTIGYGATYYEDGTAVTLADPPITRTRAEQLLVWMLRTRYLPAVLRACPGLLAETPERLGALVDFAFNLGAGALQASTLRQRVNASRWGDVPAQLARWVYAGGAVMRGLVLRRAAEAALV